MTPQEIKQQAHTEFVKSFVKMSLTNRPTFYGIKFEDLDQVCYFIDSLIDRTVQMTEERIVGIVNDYFNTVMFDEWSSGELTKLITNKSEINK